MTTQRFWCPTCEQVGNAGDHDCEPQGLEEFLAWLRAEYVQRGSLTWGGLCSGWALYKGGMYSALDVVQQVDQYLRYLQDVTGEVVCDTQVYPPVYYPRGMEPARAAAQAHQGLQQHLDAAVKLATERKRGKVQI